MRTSPTCTHDSPYLIRSAWVINYWLVDANTHVLSPIITTNVGVAKPSIVTANLETNAAKEEVDKYVSTTTALLIMDPYESEALMRLIASLFENESSAKVDTLIDTTISLNFCYGQWFLQRLKKCF